MADGSKIDPQFVAALITHLEIRSEFLREEFSTKLQGAVGGLTQQLKSPQRLKEIMARYLKENPDRLYKLLAKNFVPPDQRALLSEHARHVVEAMPNKEILARMEPGLQQIEELSHLLPGFIKEGQNKFLADSAVNVQRTELYRDFDYTVFRPRTGSFILPDTTMCFVKKKGAAPFSQKGDEIEVVIVPISSDVAIVDRGIAYGI